MTLFEEFSQVLQSDEPTKVRDQRLLMGSYEDISIYYAPFEYNNPNAKIVLVGITPGPTQMVNANNEARRSLLAGCNDTIAMKNAKETAGFSGDIMRYNLIRQLNHWEVHQWLGLQNSSELFSSSRDLLQTTSLLRYPVFVNDNDYKGHPNMLNNPFLKRYLFDYFVKDVNKLEGAVIFPLGTAVTKVIDSLVKEGAIDKQKVMTGMCHPSGQNTYRINYFTGDRNGAIPHATNPKPYDQGREYFKSLFL